MPTITDLLQYIGVSFCGVCAVCLFGIAVTAAGVLFWDSAKDLRWMLSWRFYCLGNIELAKAELIKAVAREYSESNSVQLLAMLIDIDYLRKDEGDSVEIFCDNPEGVGRNNRAIVCRGAWTGWAPNGILFEGPTLSKAVDKAVQERKSRLDDEQGTPIGPTVSV